MSDKIKLSILMPVKNEGTHLQIILRILKALVNLPHEVLVVYDTLDDNSIPVINRIKKEYLQVRGVHNKLGRGVANAIKSGVEAASGDYVLVMAADDIGPLIIINYMVSLMDKGCSLVNATRYVYGGKNIGGSFISKFLSTTANKLFYILSDSSLTDPTLGVKMFRRSLFNQIKLESKPVGWAVSFEFAIKAQLAGWKLGEVPLISLNRLFGGKSSFRFGPWVVEYTKWFLWGLKKLPRSSFRKKAPLRIHLT